MKAIDIEGVQPGDILFTARPGKLERNIRRLTAGEVSHAMICVGPASFIDSTQAGVQANNLQRELFEDDEKAYQFRLKAAATQDAIDRIVNYARSQIGTRYSVLDAVRSVIPVGRRPSRRQFCSRLVARAYAAAGIQLLPDTEFCSPEDLRNSPLLVEIPISMQPVSAEEIEWRNSRVDPIAAMQRAQNDVLAVARAIDPHVESMEDIISLLMRDINADEPINAAMKSSGYLDLWRLEVDAHPWRYQPGLIDEEFDDTHQAGLRQYCLSTARGAYTGGVRFSQNLAILRSLNARAPRRSFQSEIALYETLERNHQMRREIAYRWLSKHFPHDLETEMEQVEPHSPQWYAIVDPVNPHAAAMTRAAIDAAGNDAVCSVCGDAPSLRYRLAGVSETLSGIPSLRLCDECFGHRASMSEIWQRFLR
jgi:hypothetical protein